MLAGCAATPTSIVMQPTTARPLSQPPPAPADGAIFQNAAYRPFFEDRRARQVGDVITVTISERTNAVKAGSSSGTKTLVADIDARLPVNAVRVAAGHPLTATLGAMFGPIAVQKAGEAA